MFSFFGDIWAKCRVGVSKIGVCVLLCFCEAGVFVLLFGANQDDNDGDGDWCFTATFVHLVG